MTLTNGTKGEGFLAEVSAEASEAFVDLASPIVLRTGQAVFRQGDPAWMIGLVRTGELELRSVSPQGRSDLIRMLVPGDLFGHMTAMSGRPQIGTATATRPTELLAMNVTEFDWLLTRFPDLNQWLVESLMARVTRAVADPHPQDEAGGQRLARMLQAISSSTTTVGGATSTMTGRRSPSGGTGGV